jgi:transcriptional regulator with XRE-family HTH domain
MATITEISARLRRAARDAGMTQQSLREAAGISRQTLVNVFKGTEDFRVSTLLALADRLGLEVLLVPKSAARGLQPQAVAPVVETVVDQVRKRLRGADGGSDPEQRR